MTDTKAGTPPHPAPQVRIVAAPSCAAAVPTQPAAARATATAAEPGSRRGWASVGAVALGAFVVVMTETLPVGLLPKIAGRAWWRAPPRSRPSGRLPRAGSARPRCTTRS